jgi:hypothetical protein
MVVAMRANPHGSIQVTMKNHLAAGWALFPQGFTIILLADKGPDFGANKIGKPVHALLIP